MASKAAEGESVFSKWLGSLKESDLPLYEELTARLRHHAENPEEVRPEGSVVSLESVSREANVDLSATALETIVREGRPAFRVLESRIDFDSTKPDATAKVVVERLTAAAKIVEQIIPLVGRIDVDNYPASIDYVGTGWLVGADIVVTNRHVAELIASGDEGKFRFRPGRFGEDMRVTLNFRHEREPENDTAAVSRVSRVIWIEPDPKKADIAFLQVERRADGTQPKFIPLAESDAAPGSDVAVVGYPARAPAHIIPDQAWMDQIYGSTYDIKRVAPGLMGGVNRGWATHDCTTLGGNSGSVVVDMKTGRAVALHFAGAYMIENYGVAASTIRQYIKDEPWRSGQRRETTSCGSRRGSTTQPTPRRLPATPPSQPPGGQLSSSSRAGSQTDRQAASQGLDNPAAVSVTVPLNITISLGQPTTAGAGAPALTDAAHDGGAASGDINEAARALLRERRAEGVYSIWAGYEISAGRLTDNETLVVSAHPERLQAVREAMPRAYGQFPVEVRPASVIELTGEAALAEAPDASISYNDEDRTGSGFSFDWIEDEMTVRLHVGPERSWKVLSEFLGAARKELVSSMYEFHAAHIAEAVEEELAKGRAMTLVLARQSRDPASGQIAAGDFDRSETFGRWEEKFSDRFEHIYVPLGTRGLVANSYHIKVTVRDETHVWLSSGNWKRASQPLIADADLDNPKVTSRAGNREWHAVIEHEELAARFRNHILADLEQSRKLGGTESVADIEQMIDVPAAMLEAVELEGPPSHVIEPREFTRRVRVKPLLTPDKQGGVYSRAVLQLINSAKKQLLFQNQYIMMSGADGGFFKQLVDALAAKAQELDDFRVILRSGGDSQAYDLSQLKRRGVDVNNQVRILTNTHTKGIIVDGKRVLVGSHNWSSSGVTLNRDASLIFDDEEAAQYYAEAFELDWERASEPRFDEAVTEGVRPAEGDAPPGGYVRMSLSEYLEG